MDILVLGLLCWFGGGSVGSMLGAAGAMAQAKAQADYARKMAEMEVKRARSST